MKKLIVSIGLMALIYTSLLSQNLWVLDDCDPEWENPPFHDSLKVVQPDGTFLMAKGGFKITRLIGGSKRLTVSQDGQSCWMGTSDSLYNIDIHGNIEFKIPRMVWAVDIAKSELAYALIYNYTDSLIVLDKQGTVVKGEAYKGLVDIVIDDDNSSVWLVGQDIKRLNLDLQLQFTIDPIEWYATSVDYASDGTAWISERHHPDFSESKNRLLHINLDGTILDSVNMPASPMCVRVDRIDGTVWIATITSLYQYIPSQDELDLIDVMYCFTLSIDQQNDVIWVGTDSDVRSYTKAGELQTVLTNFSESSQKFVATNKCISNGLEDSVLVVFNDPHLEEAVREALEKPVGDIYNTSMETLTSFSAENDSISDLTGLEYAVNLTELFMNYNLIIEITPLQSLTSLNRLELYDNNIIDITPLQNLTNLSNLNLVGNQISDITTLQYLINLKYLYLDENPITDFSGIQNLTNLLNLMCNHLGISDLSIFQNLTNLKELTLENNNICDLIPLHNLNQLNVLYITSNQISDLTPLQNMTSLTFIKLAYNQITDISPLQNLTNLNSLDLSVNQISDISVIQNITNLESLTLWGNQIKDITPLQNLTNLINLHLMTNQITDISAFQNLNNLSFLSLSNNPIQDISPVQELTKLTCLFASNLQLKDINPLQDLVELGRLGLDGNMLDNEDLASLYDLDKLTTLYLKNNPGIISGTQVQMLANNLDLMNCEDIQWDGTCGIDSNKAVICWCDPPDTVGVEEIVTVQATATDSCQKQVQMKIDWGDGNISDYTELKANASNCEFSHSYAAKGNYNIRVIAMNESAVETDWSRSYTIVVGEPTVSVETERNVIKEFSLKQNYPNPFNPVTTIQYDLPKSIKIKISIYNMLGQEIKILKNKTHQPGSYKVQWDGRNEYGNSMTSGIYFCRIQTEEFVKSIKLMLIR